MSGHSKWATTKRAKAAVDAKRSNLFTKLTKNIMVAAKDGADPSTNFKLRIAVDKARAMSMPKENIERAIKKGSGDGEGASIETLLYEAFGPEGTALLIEILTDNRNRSAANFKHILAENGGKFATEGSVKWMFEPKGQIKLKTDKINDEQELALIEAGAQDIVSEDTVKIICSINDLQLVKEAAANLGLEAESVELVYVAKDKIKPQDPDKIIELLDALDDDDDVNNIFINADL